MFTYKIIEDKMALKDKEIKNLIKFAQEEVCKSGGQCTAEPADCGAKLSVSMPGGTFYVFRISRQEMRPAEQVKKAFISNHRMKLAR